MLSVDWPSTECRPITDRYIGQVSTNYRPTIGEVSAKCRWTKSYIGRDTSGTTIDRVSTECRLTIDRLSTAISTDCQLSVDRVSTDCRPTVNRLSTECWPTIDRVSTAISTAMSSDISVNITYSKQDPINVHTQERNPISVSTVMQGAWTDTHRSETLSMQVLWKML